MNTVTIMIIIIIYSRIMAIVAIIVDHRPSSPQLFKAAYLFVLGGGGARTMTILVAGPVSTVGSATNNP